MSSLKLLSILLGLLLLCSSPAWSAPRAQSGDTAASSRPAVGQPKSQPPNPAQSQQPSTAEQQLADVPKPCYGDNQPKWVVSDGFFALSNALGFENQARFGRCWPLIEKRGILYDYTNVEIGLFHYLSLPYTHQGAFFSITPLSILNFRLELGGLYIWPVTFLTGAAHYPRSGYDDSFWSDGIDHDLDVKDAKSAGGLNIAFNTTLQAAVTLAELPRGNLELLIINSFGIEYWLVGNTPYYYNLRKDVILARSDWILTNAALVLLGIPLSSNLSLRVGAMDMLVHIPRAHRVGSNQVGGLISLGFEKLGQQGRVRGLSLFLFVGGYTHHAHRELDLLVNFLAGVELSVVLFTPRPSPR